ncbi:MAG TPA: hypothetical protein VNJ31_12040 [Methyloceanibacter sp.]|nr:hypothetical protein [Methyloceanibacter sp.]
MAAESWSPKELLAAGWTEADLAWERASERAVAAFAEGDAARAKEEAGEALRIARENFAAIDPRLGTALANYGVCLDAAGHGEAIALLFRQGLDVWRSSAPWVARMDAPRIARSSLFHMRMEARHRPTYRARWQMRWREIAAEAKHRLRMLDSESVALESATAALARWRRERPAMLNDTRKLMAAAFLLLAPQTSGESD